MLARETLMTEEQARDEDRISAMVASACGSMSSLKIGVDDPEKEKPRIDRALHDGERIVAFFEVKTSSYRFGECQQFTISARKIEAGRKLFEISRVPVFIAVRFACSTIALLHVNKPYRRWENWGRTDRGQGAADLEVGAKFEWHQFKRINAAAV